MNLNEFKDKIPGGLAKGKTLADIASKHKYSLSKLRNNLEMGIKVEMEHTTSKSVAREIAMDHLFENPEYYQKLKNIEND